ncbi:nitroreductase [Bacillus lacus]|uniref:Nitroreductase n=1 Tax=Metabacillus lacus TaxID=1983721 RepID=A0A7X2M0W0_9BACI|nr:nitroreductase family protein [Metabacillus lacus]MRX73732.1 nitroreductase [Metabacillus lacus]
MGIFDKVTGKENETINLESFQAAVENRRSIYTLSKESTVSDTRLKDIVEHAVKHTPSSFNSQSARVLVVIGDQHDKLWELTKETLRNIVPAESFSATEEKMESFKNSYGTVLFFEDQEVVESLQKQFELYKDNFPLWSQQSNGMLQFVIWTALEIEGLGASLQHYNPLIDEDVRAEWNLPDSWKLIAQMPFGKPAAPAGDKEFMPLDERVIFAE